MNTFIWGVAAFVLVVWAVQRGQPSVSKGRGGNRSALPDSTARSKAQSPSGSAKGEGSDAAGDAGGGD